MKNTLIEKNVRVAADHLADAGDSMIDGLFALLVVRDAVAIGLHEGEHPLEGAPFDDMLLAQAQLIRGLASMLMRVGRGYGARYWNVGVSFHDKLDKWSGLYRVDLGATEEL